MKIDISLWDFPSRMRERIKNLATMVMSISAVNGFALIIYKNWILVAINFIFLLATLPVFISYSKWQKEPPKEIIDIKENKK